MTRRAIVVSAALAAWIAGVSLGAAAPQDIGTSNASIQISRAHADYAPALTGTEPVFILLIGGDARAGTDPAHSLADSIHVLAIDPARSRGTIVGIPRDSWVDVPGHGMGKINSAMVDGGPSLLVQTVEQLMHIRIAYFALTTFQELTSFVDAIGGVTVRVACPMDDPFSRSTFDPGPRHMSGADVLAFSRDRHSFVLGDLARSEDGGRAILGALTGFRRAFAEDPGVLLGWMALGLRNVRTDVPPLELAILAFTASTIRPADMQNLVVPASEGIENSLYVVRVDPSADRMFVDLADDGFVRAANAPESPLDRC